MLIDFEGLEIYLKIEKMKTFWLHSDPALLGKIKGMLPGHVLGEFHSSLTESSFQSVPWDKLDLLFMDFALGSERTLPWVPAARKINPALPIVIITQSATKESCVEAINYGIDGLIEHPITLEKIQPILDKHQPETEPLKLDQDRKSVFSENRWIDLTSTEFKILETLKVAQKRISRADLQRAIWPNASISENNLDTHLTNLKKKIPELIHILSVRRGLGYFLDPKKK
jgi:two-component system phosphate regulon response regulator PhoB